MEYQYDAARPLILERADLVVWLDLPTSVTMWRLLRRTITRRVTREELWNGNREGPLWRALIDRDHVLRWGWRTRDLPARRAAAIAAARPGLPVVRLRTRKQVRLWLETVARAASARNR
jgi:adenylate kinase family enzyme